MRKGLKSFMPVIGMLIVCLGIPGISESASQSGVPSPESDPGEEPLALETQTKTVALRGDDERLRPESQFQTWIGDTLLTLTGAVSTDLNYQRNLDLDFNRQRDRFRWNTDVAINAIFSFPHGFYLFTELAMEDELTFREHDPTRNDFQLQVDELFFQGPFTTSLPLIFRVGRQQFFEERRWYLDDNFDALRILFDPAPWHIRASVSVPVNNPNSQLRFFDDIDVNRSQLDGMIDVTYDFHPLEQKSKAGFYILVRDDYSARDENPIWIGLRSYGRPKFKFDYNGNKTLQNLLKPRIKYWFDAAFVAGNVRSNRIRGFGLDIGATYIARKWAYEPYLTLGYAYGSGDSNPTNGTDSNFRQTGFQGNSGKFGGVVNFDYYGVLFDPELSNLHIFTVGVGMRPFEDSSIDVVYHHYEQDAPSVRIRSFDTAANLNGLNSELGDEIDMVLGIRALKNTRIRWRNGYFFPGPAFVKRDAAFETRMDIQVSF